MDRTEKDLNEKLIYLVEERPPLYMPSDSLYHDRNVQDLLWQQIATHLSMTAVQVKKRWQTLRASFSRAMSEEKPLPSGSAAKKPKTEWYLKRQMSFLIPFMKHSSMSGNLSSNNNESQAVEASSSSQIQNESVIACDGLDAPFLKKAKTIKKRPKNEVDEMMMKFISSRTLPSCRCSASKEEDPDLSFFKGLLPEFKLLNPTKKRKFKLKVLSVLDSFLDSENDDQSRDNNNYENDEKTIELLQ